MKTNFHWKRVGFALISFILLILFDQWTKSLAVANLMNQEPFVILKDVFQLRYLENRGAAFGMMQGQQTFFVISALIAVVVITYVYFKLPWEKRFHPLRVVVLFIAAGAVGNLIDRLVLGYVVDFFYFELIDFPIFNVADIYVTVTVFVLVFLILFYYKEEDLDRIFTRRK
jgi:signal peptidase II